VHKFPNKMFHIEARKNNKNDKYRTVAESKRDDAISTAENENVLYGC